MNEENPIQDPNRTSETNPTPPPVINPGNNTNPNPQENEVSFTTKVSHHVADWAGVERLEGFKLGDVFSEAFKKHSTAEVEDYFTVGSPSTTPLLENVDTNWPKPWVFLRTFIAAALVYLLFVEMWKEYQNENLLPGLIMVGSFAVPISALIFFFEMNARKNVSLYQVLRLLFLGGAISLFVSLFFFRQTDYTQLEASLGASIAGIVEEPGKLAALLIVANVTRYRYILNGLLFGAAVGTGFAAFESAGYALRAGFYESQESMLDNIMVRGMLSPFSHIIWTAMCGAALWRVKGDQRFRLEMLLDPKFYRVFLMAVILHMIWNSALHLPLYGKYIILGAIGWIIIFSLIQQGLKQIKAEKQVITSS